MGTDTPRPKSGSRKSNSIKIVVTEDSDNKITEMDIQEKQISVKEIPQEDVFKRSGMMFGNMKNFENSPPPTDQGCGTSKNFSFDDNTVKSLTEIDVIEEEYEDDFEESESDLKNLSEKYQGKEIAQVKPLSRENDEEDGGATEEK